MYKLIELLSNERNARYRIIYYSSFNPVTIQEITSAWGYRSPTYLYQKESLKTLIEHKFILEEEYKDKKVIRSRMKPIFSKNNIEKVRVTINEVIELDVLREFNPTITKEALEIEKYKELVIQALPKGYSKNIDRRSFSLEDFMTLVELWKDPFFIRIFLSLNIISRFSKEDLSSNPLEFLFKYTCSFYEECFDVLGTNQGGEFIVPYELSPFYLEEYLPLILKNLTKAKEELSTSEFESFRKKHRASYNLIIEKFKETFTDDTPKKWITKEIIRHIGIGGDQNG